MLEMSSGPNTTQLQQMMCNTHSFEGATKPSGLNCCCLAEARAERLCCSQTHATVNHGLGLTLSALWEIQGLLINNCSAGQITAQFRSDFFLFSFVLLHKVPRQALPRGTSLLQHLCLHTGLPKEQQFQVTLLKRPEGKTTPLKDFENPWHL